MPVYEYRCKSCGKTHEIEHGFHDERPTKCPSCGGVLVRVFHPIGVVFKGSGFYKTDYGGTSAARQTSGEGANSTESKPAAEKSADSSPAPAAKPAESKPKSDPKPPSTSSSS